MRLRKIKINELQKAQNILKFIFLNELKCKFKLFFN